VAIVGGIESLWGATVGAALLTLGPELLREVSAPALAAALPPAVLLLVVALRPAGLTSLVPAGLPAARLRWPATRWRRAAAIDLRTSSAAGRTLRADGVVVAFGEFRAVDGLTITAEPGEVVALIGPNGAGKTTLFDAVSGFVPLADGRITLGSQRLDRLRPFRRLRAGCGRTFQSGGLFPRLSLRDNVDIPRRWHRLDGPPADELLAAAGVSSPGHTATDVPPGIARTAELVRILALRPGVLLLDEPTAGLARSESDAMVRFVKDRAGDTAVLLIEHDVRVIAATDRVVVMDQGRLLASGPPDEIRRDPAVIAAYLGSAAPPRGPAAAAPLADRPGSAGYGAPIDESAR
jgi:ABC-type branched-subunit amino acid transport system ATPase component